MLKKVLFFVFLAASSNFSMAVEKNTELLYSMTTKSKIFDIFSFVTINKPKQDKIVFDKKAICSLDNLENGLALNTNLSEGMSYTILALSETKDTIKTLITIELSKKPSKTKLDTVKVNEHCDFVTGTLNVTKFNVIKDFKLGELETIKLPNNDELYIKVLKQNQ